MLREDLRTVRGSARRDRSGLASVICDTSTSRSTSWCSRLLKMRSRSCPGSLVSGRSQRPGSALNVAQVARSLAVPKHRPLIGVSLPC